MTLLAFAVPSASLPSPVPGEWSSRFLRRVLDPLTDRDLLSRFFLLSFSLCLCGVLLLGFLWSSSPLFRGNALPPSLLSDSTGFLFSSFSLTFFFSGYSLGLSLLFS